MNHKIDQTFILQTNEPNPADKRATTSIQSNTRSQTTVVLMLDDRQRPRG